jgi:hypothetical protein
LSWRMHWWSWIWVFTTMITYEFILSLVMLWAYGTAMDLKCYVLWVD